MNRQARCKHVNSHVKEYTTGTAQYDIVDCDDCHTTWRRPRPAPVNSASVNPDPVTDDLHAKLEDFGFDGTVGYGGGG
jgi:hypothetical protein